MQCARCSLGRAPRLQQGARASSQRDALVDSTHLVKLEDSVALVIDLLQDGCGRTCARRRRAGVWAQSAQVAHWSRQALRGPLPRPVDPPLPPQHTPQPSRQPCVTRVPAHTTRVHSRNRSATRREVRRRRAHGTRAGTCLQRAGERRGQQQPKQRGRRRPRRASRSRRSKTPRHWRRASAHTSVRPRLRRHPQRPAQLASRPATHSVTG